MTLKRSEAADFKLLDTAVGYVRVVGLQTTSRSFGYRTFGISIIHAASRYVNS